MGGRGRAPCCQKVGLNKGSWTPEEDARLIAHISQHGHGNWRALPKRAGLLRCGKSCRLRWINYLRPDVKRGNFSKEEEETIIKLHELLGNKWAKIASHLPGRTDNEIKNVWNTHLKKRLKLESPVIQSRAQEEDSTSSLYNDGKESSDNIGTPMEPLFDYLWGMLDEASTLISNEDDILEETRRWLADLEELGLDIND